MKIKLLISRAGVGFVHKVGDIIDVPEAEAIALMEAAPPKAVPVREVADVEVAAAKPSRRKKV